MIDMYALPITLRYKNQRKFYTNFGALATLIIFLILFNLAFVDTFDMINKPTDAMKIQQIKQSSLIDFQGSLEMYPHFIYGYRLVDKATKEVFEGDVSTIYVTIEEYFVSEVINYKWGL